MVSLIVLIHTYEKHGDDNATGEEGSRRVAGEEEVDDEHDDHGGVGELLVGVLGVQVVHSLLPRPVEQGGRLTEGPIPQDLVGSVLPGQDLILDDAGVELEVDLVVTVAGVCGKADILVLAVRVSGVIGT